MTLHVAHQKILISLQGSLCDQISLEGIQADVEALTQ